MDNGVRPDAQFESLLPLHVSSSTYIYQVSSTTLLSNTLGLKVTTLQVSVATALWKHRKWSSPSLQTALSVFDMGLGTTTVPYFRFSKVSLHAFALENVSIVCDKINL
jgi:hypothetical protein